MATLSSCLYGGMVDAVKVYGPYTRKDGRQHVILYEDGERRTMSYPKFLLVAPKNIIEAIEFGAYYDVDHINNNFGDNRIENLQFLSRLDNVQKSIINLWYSFVCSCGVNAKIPLRTYRHNQLRQQKSGPYCSKHCAGLVRPK